MKRLSALKIYYCNFFIVSALVIILAILFFRFQIVPVDSRYFEIDPNRVLLSLQKRWEIISYKEFTELTPDIDSRGRLNLRYFAQIALKNDRSLNLKNFTITYDIIFHGANSYGLKTILIDDNGQRYVFYLSNREDDVSGFYYESNGELLKIDAEETRGLNYHSKQCNVRIQASDNKLMVYINEQLLEAISGISLSLESLRFQNTRFDSCSIDNFKLIGYEELRDRKWFAHTMKKERVVISDDFNYGLPHWIFYNKIGRHKVWIIECIFLIILSLVFDSLFLLLFHRRGMESIVIFESFLIPIITGLLTLKWVLGLSAVSVFIAIAAIIMIRFCFLIGSRKQFLVLQDAGEKKPVKPVSIFGVSFRIRPDYSYLLIIIGCSFGLCFSPAGGAISALFNIHPITALACFLLIWSGYFFLMHLASLISEKDILKFDSLAYLPLFLVFMLSYVFIYKKGEHGNLEVLLIIAAFILTLSLKLIYVLVNQRKPKLARLFIACIVISIFVSAECMIRFSPLENSPTWNFTHLLKTFYWDIEEHTNLFGNHTGNVSEGFPRGTYPVKKDDGVIRIVCFGTSSTEGWPIEDTKKAYPSILEKYLNQKDNDTLNYEVFNAGIGGYTSFKLLINLKDIVLKLKPDLITFYLGHNDWSLFHFKTDREFWEEIKSLKKNYPSISTNRDLVIADSLRFKNSIIRTVFGICYNSRLFKGLCSWSMYLKRPAKKVRQVPLEDFRWVLEEIVDTAKSHKIKIIFIPEAENTFCEPFKNYTDVMRDVAIENNLLFLDLRHALYQHRHEDIFFDLVHPLPLGHKIIARQLYEVIKDL